MGEISGRGGLGPAIRKRCSPEPRQEPEGAALG